MGPVESAWQRPLSILYGSANPPPEPAQGVDLDAVERMMQESETEVAAANEDGKKLTARLAEKIPKCRTMSVQWGQS